MATKKKSGVSNNQAVGIGVGLTAAAVAAAGAFFLYGSKNAAKNRKAVKSWTLKAKADVLEKIEQAKDMSKEEYEQLIDTVSGAYKDVKNASKVDLATFKKEMKEHWNNIAKTAIGPKKVAPKKSVKPAVTKSVVSKPAVTKAKTTAPKVAKK